MAKAAVEYLDEVAHAQDLSADAESMLDSAKELREDIPVKVLEPKSEETAPELKDEDKNGVAEIEPTEVDQADDETEILRAQNVANISEQANAVL